MATEATQREKLVQLQALNEFLAKITALDTVDKRFDRYSEVFHKLHAQQAQTQRNWSTSACKRGDLGELVQKIANLTIANPELVELSKLIPISMKQLSFFKAFSVCMEHNLREVAVDRSWRRNCPPNSKWYNTQLIAHIDKYLASLDIFMRLQQEADRLHEITQDANRLDAEAAEYDEKGTRKDMTNHEFKMTNEFLEVILFLFAVPQEVPLPARHRKFHGAELVPPLEPFQVDMDVTWMNDDCKWYQQNETFMGFLEDYAVIALMKDYYSFSPSLTEICQSYINVLPDYENTDAFEEHVRPQVETGDDLVHHIADSVRRDAHERRPTTATRRALLELQALYTVQV